MLVRVSSNFRAFHLRSGLISDGRWVASFPKTVRRSEEMVINSIHTLHNVGSVVTTLSVMGTTIVKGR